MKHVDSPPEIEIEPIAFRSDPSPGRSGSLFTFNRIPSIKWILGPAVVLFLIGLMGVAWFVFTARQVIIGIRPEPDLVSIEGGIISPRFKNYYLLRPGIYALQVKKNGYYPMSEQINITDDKNQILNFTLEKLPGKISLTAYQVKRPETTIEGAAVTIDGKEIGKTPLKEVSVKAGRRQLVIRAPSYKELKTPVTVEGMGQIQKFSFALLPGWADVTVRSVPESADVIIDDRRKGKTPVTLKLAEGTHELKLSARQHKPRTIKLTVKANQPKSLDPIRLEPRDGILALDTQPSGASVTIGDNYIGQTPVKFPLKPDVFHTIHISKAGYKQTTKKIKVAVAEKRQIDVDLLPEFGVIQLTVKPPDAILFVDGNRLGEAPSHLKMIAVEHTLEARKEGYEPVVTQITPRPGFPQQLEIVLRQKGQNQKPQPAVIKASNGYTLTLVRPKSFTMGSSRREQGRRSNEALRKIELKRLFYMGTREVTNKEFREYLSTHNSGAFKTQTLNRSDQPVVQVTWKQAAFFCNWLSKKEGLSPAYTQKGENTVATEPLTTGYRLPTEAEWEYCARFAHSGAPLKYPWGNHYPPANTTVNIADLSAKDILSATLDRYSDGYPVSSPSGAFSSNDLGLYDLGGNVAEWCHDYYSIIPYSTQKMYLDPSGPKEGKHRIVRGSSWRHAGISALRSAYRDYSNGKRVDLGFRICRYAR